jgi:hypothetical protein
MTDEIIELQDEEEMEREKQYDEKLIDAEDIVSRFLGNRLRCT